MELKFIALNSSGSPPLSGSNRTFMELKSTTWSMQDKPLTSSNRTFMELKFIKQSSCKKRCRVLIVPLWN